jgi:hypothetical protein
MLTGQWWRRLVTIGAVVLAVIIAAPTAYGQTDRDALAQVETRRCLNNLMPAADVFRASSTLLEYVCSCGAQALAGRVPEQNIPSLLASLRASAAPDWYRQAEIAAFQACLANAPFSGGPSVCLNFGARFIGCK